MGVIVAEDEYWYYTANGGRSPRPRDWQTGKPLPPSGGGIEWRGGGSRPTQAGGVTNTGGIGARNTGGVTNPAPQTTYQNHNALVDARNAAAEIARQNRERQSAPQMQFMPLRPDQYYGAGRQPNTIGFTDGANLPMYGAGRQPTMGQFFGSAPPTFTNPYSGVTSWNYAGLSANPFRNMAGINENMNNILASRLMRY